MGRRQNQEGYATLIVIIFVAILFIMLTAALEFSAQWHRNNRIAEKKLQEKADKITVLENSQ